MTNVTVKITGRGRKAQEFTHDVDESPVFVWIDPKRFEGTTEEYERAVRRIARTANNYAAISQKQAEETAETAEEESDDVG